SATAPAVVRVGAIFSSKQSASQSYLRFYNTDSDAGTATVTLRDYLSGNILGTWTSPSIPGGGELQYDIGTVERDTHATFTKPDYSTMDGAPDFEGYFQLVLFRPADGTLTNLSTCDTGVTANPGRLSGVHSSLLAAGYPSSVVVTNTGTA